MPQKFRREWLQEPKFKSWLTPIESSTGILPKCKACQKLLSNKHSDLVRHVESKKHKEMSKVILSPSQPKINSVIRDNFKEKIAEVRLCLFISVHSSIRNIDHLSEVCKTSFSCQSAKSLQIHRTKTTAIINNVMGPYFKNQLQQDLTDVPYSILIDESTDISTKKVLGIIIMYFSKKRTKFVTTYLGMPQLSEFNASAIVQGIKDVLKEYNLNLMKMIGIGSDNASVMVGVNNGVYAKLKVEIPHLLLVRCVCHSLQLAVSSAATKWLPRSVEFLIRESYSWFSHSSSRQSSYETLYQTINDGQEPLKIVRSCETRWLSIESAVKRILDQWIELKTHFEIAQSAERCYTSQQLFMLYSDEKIHAFLNFLQSILCEVQHVNKLFESNLVDPTKLLNEMQKLIDILVSKICIPRFNKYNIFKENIGNYINEKAYLGYNVENTLDTIRENGKLPPFEEKEFRDRCINFTLHLIEEIKNRFPENMDVLSKVTHIGVNNALSPVYKTSLTSLLMHFNYSAQEIDRIEQKWNQIHLLSWKNINSTKDFWIEVYKFKDASEENPFQELASFAMLLLIVPHSNADVERLFSQMNLVKTKLRNRLLLPTVNNILHIKYGVKLNDQCCHNFPLDREILSKIKTKASYSEFNTIAEHVLEENVFDLIT